jgi:hypothetical protein
VRTTKLTLSIEPEIVREAKRSAAARHTSLSALFARLLRAMSARRAEDMAASPVTRRAMGLVDLSGGKEDTELLAEALESKHGAAR